MQYYYRVFLWKNGAKQEELTKYVTVPIYQEIRMDGTVGGGKITLDAMPTAKYGKPYSPKTKIVIERYTTKDFTDTPKRWDYIVKQDTVEIYQGYPKLCNHAIELYDPTIVLMDLHCDNIAWTHELHDVTLNYKTTYEEAETVKKNGFDKKEAVQYEDKNETVEAKGVFERPLENVVRDVYPPNSHPMAPPIKCYYTEKFEFKNDVIVWRDAYYGIGQGVQFPRNTGAQYSFKNSYRYRWDKEKFTIYTKFAIPFRYNKR